MSEGAQAVEDHGLYDLDFVCSFFGGNKPLNAATVYRGIAALRYPAPRRVSPNSSRWLGSDLKAAKQKLLDLPRKSFRTGIAPAPIERQAQAPAAASRALETVVNPRLLDVALLEIASVEPILQFFAFAHLPKDLQAVSRPFAELAIDLVETLPRNPEHTVALRKLLEAKDCAVRARLFKAGEAGR